MNIKANEVHKVSKNAFGMCVYSNLESVAEYPYWGTMLYVINDSY